MVKEGYASPEPTRDWIVTVGGRAGASMERNPGMRLLLVKRETCVGSTSDARVGL